LGSGFGRLRSERLIGGFLLSHRTICCLNLGDERRESLIRRGNGHKIGCTCRGRPKNGVVGGCGRWKPRLAEMNDAEAAECLFVWSDRAGLETGVDTVPMI